MTWKDHLEILLKVCDAVAYAHSKAILHRDLKPENIMLGEFGEVYVMDWGLAMYFDERNEYKRFPELKPQLAGTPYYIAPEMVRGEMKSLGPASDVYLLGGILYEILTGRPPHEGKPIMDLLRKAATGVVPAPEEASDSPLITAGPVPHRHEGVGAPHPATAIRPCADFQQDLREYLANSESMAVCAARRRTVCGHPERVAAGRPRRADGAPTHRPGGRRRPATASCRSASAATSRRIALWTGNDEARRGLLDALSLQIRLAIRQDDLTLARAQFRPAGPGSKRAGSGVAAVAGANPRRAGRTSRRRSRRARRSSTGRPGKRADGRPRPEPWARWWWPAWPPS